MKRFDRTDQILAICLSAFAGYLDAIGFIASGGYFVSFMSGNTTRAAVGLFDTTINAALAGSLIASFVAGVAAGSILGHAVQPRRRFAILLMMTALLAGAALCHQAGHVWSMALLLAFAMGAENALFERDGETRVGLTYMTGTLVRIGQGVAGYVTGQRRDGWMLYLLLWAGLAGGAVIGTLAYSALQTAAIWLAAAGALVLALGCRLKAR